MYVVVYESPASPMDSYATQQLTKQYGSPLGHHINGLGEYDQSSVAKKPPMGGFFVGVVQMPGKMEQAMGTEGLHEGPGMLPVQRV